jgi:hypothetical protein
MAVKKSTTSSRRSGSAQPTPSRRSGQTVSSPRRGTGGKFTSKPKPVVDEVDEELENSAVSVEEAPEPEEVEEVETEETDDDLDEDGEDAEEYEEEDDEEDEEEDEDEDPISEETQAALAEAMEKGSETPPVEIRYMTLAEIKMAKDITEEPYYVEDWDGWVLIRSPKARQIMDMVKGSGQGALTLENGRPATDDIDFDVMMKDLIKMSLVNPVIDDEGYEALMEKAAGPVMEIFGKIREVAKLDRISSSGKKIDAVKEEEKSFRKG